MSTKKINESLQDLGQEEEKVDTKLPRCKVGVQSCQHFAAGRRCKAPLTKILIDEEKGKPNYETVSVNGFAWQIQRGENVELPSCAIGVLEDAIGTRYVEVPNPATGHNDLIPKKHSAIPWRIVR